MFRWRRTISIRDSWRKGEKLRRSGKMTQAKELLLKATESSSPLDRHYAYIKLIQLYQDMSIDGVDYTPEIVNICLQDIDLFPQFYEAWMVEYLHSIPTPYFPSFSVLAEIYEHAEKVEEAIS
ncbi:MAG: hypothetical protein NUK65_12885, partial [Firmicutes bacterium]|nr:hypothetical protein [Bacillota bacterium]